MTHESWRSKTIPQMTPDERRLALQDAEEAEVNSRWNSEDPELDEDDRRWAYEAMVRARWRIRDLKTFENSQRFDVV